MILDFGELKEFIKKIEDVFDHKMIKEDWNHEVVDGITITEGFVILDAPPTAEVIAGIILDELYAWLMKTKPALKWKTLEVDFFEGPNSKITVTYRRK
jgi:6-pyruvoyl-tetrahydropterin synthase